MRILWLCNKMLPAIAGELGLSTSVKEGWLDGLFNRITEIMSSGSEDLELAIAFPVTEEEVRGRLNVTDQDTEQLRLNNKYISYYGFREDTTHPEIYDTSLEQRMKSIIEDFRPDLVHSFGTEYPHTLAMARALNSPDKLLIGIQGLMYVYTGAYRADLPDYVWNRKTFRDIIRKDDLQTQQKKYEIRGRYEIEALKLAGHITGRTAWDRKYTCTINPRAKYHFMNETLRECFYGRRWKPEDAEPHRIFVSQANYPIKGFHYLLRALKEIKKIYPDVMVYAAGDNVARCNRIQENSKRPLQGYETTAPSSSGKITSQNIIAPSSSGKNTPLKTIDNSSSEIITSQKTIGNNSVISKIKDRLKLSSYGLYIRELVKENGLEDNIVFTGPLNSDEMLEQYIKSSIFISPSAIENSPNSVGEAMLMGMNVITSDGGGVTGLFSGIENCSQKTGDTKDKNKNHTQIESCSQQTDVVKDNNKCITDYQEAIVYPVSDTGALTKAILYCFDSENEPQLEQMRNKAAERAAHTHDGDINCRRLLEIYREIVKEER